MPSDSHPVAGLPWIGSFSDSIDHPCDFVPWRSRIDDSGNSAFLSYHVAMTDAAGLNSDSHRSANGLRYRFIYQLKASTSAIHAYYFHQQPLLSGELGVGIVA